MQLFLPARRWASGGFCAPLLIGLTAAAALADEISLSAPQPAATSTAATSTSAATIVKKPVLGGAAVAARHPLLAVIKFARAEKVYLQKNVRSLSCRLVKRERIEDVLQEHQFIDLELQEEVLGAQGVERPLRVFLTFLGPSEVKGRKVLFIAGENSGKMLVRKGGQRFSYAIVRISPDSENAQRESLIPINELGFGQLLNHQIGVLERHLQIDPKAENTRVEHIPEASINGRGCEVIRIVHDQPQPGLEFHIANVYIDHALHVPVRIDAAGWPEQPGEEPPVIAEYTYTNLRLNVDFPEATFDEPRLKQ